MSDDFDAVPVEDMRFAFELAETIVQSCDGGGRNAFLKGIGTLAQVLYMIRTDVDREMVLKEVVETLRKYLSLLDEVTDLARALSTINAPGSNLPSRQHGWCGWRTTWCRKRHYAGRDIRAKWWANSHNPKAR